MRTRLYILNGHDPQPCANPQEWASWFESVGDGRIVAEETVDDGIEVVTLFTGFTFNHIEGDPPQLFETMAFSDGNELHIHGTRKYASWDEAAQGHAEICDRYR